MNQSEKNEDKKPTVVIVLGMAGSGKTTFVQVFYQIFVNKLTT